MICKCNKITKEKKNRKPALQRRPTIIELIIRYNDGACLIFGGISCSTVPLRCN